MLGKSFQSFHYLALQRPILIFYFGFQISQFTLYGTLTKKNQPDYKLAMKSIPANDLYNRFLGILRESYADEKIKDGAFGEMMDVELINDGPVTLVLESGPLALVNIDSSS